MSKQKFISAREVAQRLAMAGQATNQTPEAREELRRLIRAYNRQWRPGFKVDIAADAAGFRQYQIYVWDRSVNCEISLAGGAARGTLRTVQTIARREAAALAN